MRLSGRVALVTGGAVRVGRAISLALAARGAHVVVAYHTSEEAAQELVKEIAQQGLPEAVCIKCDVTSGDDVRRMFDEAERRFGTVDVLVNNAAVFPRRPVEDLTEEDFTVAIDTNLKGSYLCALEAGRRMKRRATNDESLPSETTSVGKIIQIADVAAVVPFPAYTPYCIAKAGTLMLVKCLAKAFAPNVQVNAVAPGVVLMEDGTSAEDERRALARNAIKRQGTSEDVANTVLFLIEGSDYITGETIFVDGGRRLA